MLVLVRHGESTANAAGLLLGRTDVALTELGRRQAAAAARCLGAVQRVVSSPLRRAIETAEVIAGGGTVTVDERWIEVDYGEYEGWPLGQVPADVWRSWRTDPDYRPPGGEALAAVRRRVAEAVDELFGDDHGAARDPAGDVVVVSHVSPIKAAVGWALGVPGPIDARLHLRTGAVSRIAWGNGSPVLHGFNQVPEADAAGGVAGGVAGGGRWDP